MKKILAALLCLCFGFPLAAGCSSGIAENAGTTPAPAETETAAAPVPTEENNAPARSVKHPLTERPNYVLSENATPDEMRATAVKAMQDLLTVVWYPDRTVEYEFRTYTGNYKSFKLPEWETYAGVPYTNGGSGIFQFLEYYDTATGRIKCPPGGEAFNSTLGVQCSCGVIWGVSPVASSLFYRGIGQRRADGILPVGDYWLPTVAEESSCQAICEKNGVQTMYEAYAKMKPADFITSNDHVQMAREAAVVVREADGSINGKESYIVIQDQMGGQKSDSSTYVKTEDGERRHYSGRLSVKETFEQLYNDHYLPLTCAEFQGLKPYTLPKAGLDREASTLEELAAATIHSEYNLCVFYVKIRDASGNEKYARSEVTSYADMTAEHLKDFPVSDLRLTKTALSRASGLKGDYTLELSCLDATGSIFELARFTVTL